MKKIITTLLMSSTLINYSQEAVQHYYYGTNETLGAEMYFQVRNTESSFFSKIDKAIEIAEDFIKYYPEEFEWEELDFEETLEQFLITNKHI